MSRKKIPTQDCRATFRKINAQLDIASTRLEACLKDADNMVGSPEGRAEHKDNLTDIIAKVTATKQRIVEYDEYIAEALARSSDPE